MVVTAKPARTLSKLDSVSGLKIIFLLAPGQFAGAEAVVLGGAGQARRAGLDVNIVLLRETRNPQFADEFALRAAENEVPIQMLEVNGRFDFSAFGRLRRMLSDNAVQVVHAHGYKALMYALPRRRELALVATHHGVTAHTWIVRLYHALEFRWLRYCQRVFAVSQNMATMLQVKGVPQKIVRVQENPLALNLAAVDTSITSSELPSLALSVGRLSAEKGLDILLRALADPANSDWQLRVVGDGPKREEWQRLAQQLGVAERIEWLGFQTDVRPFLQGVDVFVLPSLREGLPLALIEAAAMGLPALVSEVGATDQIVTDGFNGRLLPAADVQAWGAALAALRADADAWLAMQNYALANAAKVRQRYSLQRWVDTLQSVYTELNIPLPAKP